MERATPVVGGRRLGGWSPWPPLLLLAALALAACGGGSDGNSDPPEDASELITLQSNDGLRFQAEVRGAGDEWVLLGHQFAGRGSDWEPMAIGFAERGYRVLSWDFRCHGDSACRSEALRDATVDIWREWEAALDYAVRQGARTIHAGGASMGGTSLVVAADRSDIVSIFAISSPNHFQGLDALEDYDQVTAPKLFVVGAGDTAAPDSSQRFHEAATGPSRLEVLETELHGNRLVVDRRWGPVVHAFLYDFVADPVAFVAARTAPAPAAATVQAQEPASSLEASPPASSAQGTASRSGYVLAWLTGGDEVDNVVVADPFAPLESSLVGSYGNVIDIAWLPDGSGLAVSERETLTLVDFTTDPPEGQVVLTPQVLPAGLSADFFGADFSPDGLRYSFSVGPDDRGQGPFTPATLDFTTVTLNAPYAGAGAGVPQRAAHWSADGTTLLGVEADAIVLLDPATLVVRERLAVPTLADANFCQGEACARISFSTVFPDQFGWAPGTDGVFFARYANQLWLGRPGDTALSRWFELPGVPLEVTLSPSGTQLAWVFSGPPQGANRLMLTNVLVGQTTLLTGDDSLIFFDLEWSPDEQLVSFTSAEGAVAEPDIGVVLVNVVTGEVTGVAAGCCATWAPLAFPR